ncbi:DAF-16/FOXO Controlled, germline Tumor affecting [Ditylenchus destructor]|uniref:DAF-16/FOXO Controlled, germline Tumor affecting n=1 Tax=Ditylenchus destructor TaxID=166010 RepID=A0AAD4MR11_9BILA|nr:DAF-16/FOXO Controlled, germline Tumor affecting [Ditylenchus destructor]
MVVPFYLTYLNFAENIIGFLNQATAIVLFSHLLYCVFFKPRKLKVEKLPSLMLMYILSHWFWCCITIPIQAYMAIMWRPDRNEYNPYLIFWIGFWLNGYMVSNPLQVFFLTLDRCLILTFAETYNDHRRRIIFIVSCSSVIIFLAFAFIISLLELPLDLDKVKNCTSYPCVVIKFKGLHVYYSKIVIGTLNVIFGVGFFIALKRRNSKQIKNRIVTVTILAEIFFNVLPGYCSSLFNSISGDNIANYLGQFVGMFLTCDALFCSIIYSRIFLRRADNTTPVSKISTRPSGAGSR